ncbi:C2 domain protein [Hordeum vulgare]|nr:C2 domain protein [Hordeum vulgare]
MLNLCTTALLAAAFPVMFAKSHRFLGYVASEKIRNGFLGPPKLPILCRLEISLSQKLFRFLGIPTMAATYPMPDPPVLHNNTITQRLDNSATETAGRDKSIGYLDIFVHQARDIHNVCIYQKQDVYAKLSLTSDPQVSCSTKVINGGGQNPVFNEGLRLDVRSVEASLRCEVWMLSRVKNYLEDQLLGFALIPLSDILVADGKLTQEFSMSSSDLLHSPAGFVHLSLSYVGSSPDVIEISSLNKSASAVTDCGNGNLDPCEIEKMEFPDLNMVNENEMMVSKYFEMDCESAVKAENCKLPQHDATVPGPEICKINPSEYPDESPVSCVSITESSPELSGTPQSVSQPSETAVGAASSTESQREKSQGVTTDGEADSSEAPSKDEVAQPAVISVLQPRESVIQQDIVDMYMKSMQQFTDSLAKMKLPLDVKNGSPSADNIDSSTTEKPSPSPSSKGPRVFYGSRAFF